MAIVLTNYVLGVLVGWLAAISISVIGYLVSMRLHGVQSQRQIEEKRDLVELQ